MTILRHEESTQRSGPSGAALPLGADNVAASGPTVRGSSVAALVERAVSALRGGSLPSAGQLWSAVLAAQDQRARQLALGCYNMSFGAAHLQGMSSGPPLKLSHDLPPGGSRRDWPRDPPRGEAEIRSAHREAKRAALAVYADAAPYNHAALQRDLRADLREVRDLRLRSNLVEAKARCSALLSAMGGQLRSLLAPSSSPSHGESDQFVGDEDQIERDAVEMWGDVEGVDDELALVERMALEVHRSLLLQRCYCSTASSTTVT